MSDQPVFVKGLRMCHLCQLPSALDNCPDCGTPTPQAPLYDRNSPSGFNEPIVSNPDTMRPIPNPVLGKLYDEWVYKRVKFTCREQVVVGTVIGVETRPLRASADGEYLCVKLDEPITKYGDQIVYALPAEVKQL